MAQHELLSRLVFVDTSIYEQKNFQFNTYALANLSKYIDSGAAYLLITSSTVGEVQAHLKEKVEKAAAELKKVAKEAMILRNLPGTPWHGIFTKFDKDEVYKKLNSDFQAFINRDNVELIRPDDVSIDSLLERYFAKLPPFAEGKKRKEFPDAIALESINNISQKRGWHVYVISADGDMEKYCADKDNLVHLNDIDEFVELLLRNDAAFEEPVKLADEVYEGLQKSIIEQIRERLDDAEFYPDDYSDGEVVDREIHDVEIEGRKLIQASPDGAQFEIEALVSLTLVQSYADYERSCFDKEDQAYVFVLTTDVTKEIQKVISVYVDVGFEDSIKANACIVDIDMDSAIQIKSKDVVGVKRYENDINGE